MIPVNTNSLHSTGGDFSDRDGVINIPLYSWWIDIPSSPNAVSPINDIQYAITLQQAVWI